MRIFVIYLVINNVENLGAEREPEPTPEAKKDLKTNKKQLMVDSKSFYSCYTVQCTLYRI